MEISAVSATIPQTPVPSPQDPGTIRVILTGAAPDLIKAILFLDRVTSGDSPAEVLRVLHLNAIRITSQSGRNHRVTLVLQLEEAVT